MTAICALRRSRQRANERHDAFGDFVVRVVDTAPDRIVRPAGDLRDLDARIACGLQRLRGVDILIAPRKIGRASCRERV